MKLFRISLGLAAAVAALLPAQSLFAQSCVLCYTSVAASGGAAIRGFDEGILALLTPALLLFAGVFLLILRRARAASRAQSPAAAAQRAPVAPRSLVRLFWFRPAAARN